MADSVGTILEVSRPDLKRVERLASAAMSGMMISIMEMPEATAADVISACLTLAAKSIGITIEMSRGQEELETNRRSVRDAVYKLLLMTTEGEEAKG